MTIDDRNPELNDINPYPKIGLIILNWNNWQDTLRCIEDLRTCSYAYKEIWVLDNGSEEDSVDNLKKIKDIHFLPLDHNLGFAGGNNVGIKAALEQNCEYVLLLNNDTELSPDFIQPLLEPFANDSRAGISCPKILFKEPHQTIWFAGGKFHQPRILGELIGNGKLDQNQYNLMKKTDFAVGTCMLIKQEVFERIGMLDERLFFYHEDVDFCYRAIKADFTIWYQPKSVIIHHVASSTKNQPGQRVFLHEQARVLFLCKHVKGLNIPIVVFMEIIRFLRAIINGMMHRQMNLTRSHYEGILAGLKDSRKYLKKKS